MAAGTALIALMMEVSRFLLSAHITPDGGVRSGKLTINSSATDPTLSIALWGNGILPGTLTTSPATLYFGSVATGASSYRSATLQASGGSIVVSSASTGSAEFALTGVTFPLTIASGRSATLNLRFTPQSTGLATATLRFQSNAVNGVSAMALQGHGVAPQHSVVLSWSASQSGVEYNVYRGTNSGGPYSKINSSVDSATSYSDTSVAAGDTYYYVTTAVASDGSESAYSNQVRVAIPTPQSRHFVVETMARAHYGRYHRPIAPPIVFWLNGGSGMSPCGLCHPSDGFGSKF